MDLEAARQQLLDFLERHIHPSETVAQIMSHGVHTLPPETTVDEAAEEMLKYGFEGFPIVDDEGQIVGILTRREIDRAQAPAPGQYAGESLYDQGQHPRHARRIRWSACSR